MPGTIWNQASRTNLLSRVERLQPAITPKWGRLTCPDMLAHVNDALRMILGEVAPPPKRLPIRYFPLKQLLIYIIPFPKGVPTAPMLLARSGTAVLPDEVQSFQVIVGKLAERAGQTTWPPHPAFGSMNRRLWGVLGYRHVDHHFRQFGV